jgi:membrane associated rhomboid family serine protease
MIIPLGLNHVIRGWPRVTIAIIVICTLVQIYATAWAPSPEEVAAFIQERIRQHASLESTDPDWETAVAREAEQMADRNPIIRFGYPTGEGLSRRLFTSAFVHDGWLHLIGNMLFLWLAGAALEDRWGRLRFAGFYLAGAVAATLFFDALYSGPATLLVGASGAISALMGAFLVFFARMHIHFVYWIGFSAGTFDLVAYIALPFWFAEQLLSAGLQSATGGVSGVAFTAHIGGFLFGLVIAVIAKLVAREPADAPESDHEPPRAIARRAPAAKAKKPKDPPPPKLEAPRPKLEAPKPPEPRDPGGGPTFLT